MTSRSTGMRQTAATENMVAELLTVTSQIRDQVATLTEEVRAMASRSAPEGPSAKRAAQHATWVSQHLHSLELAGTVDAVRRIEQRLDEPPATPPLTRGAVEEIMAPIAANARQIVMGAGRAATKAERAERATIRRAMLVGAVAGSLAGMPTLATIAWLAWRLLR